jgi:hypothetical protein
MASGRTVYHVTYMQDDRRWRVLRAGADRASSVHRTKDEAIAAGRTLAKNNRPGQLVIHKKDGSIETEYTYGDDPERYPS